MSGRQKNSELKWMGKSGVTEGIIHHLFQDLNTATLKFVKTRQATWLIFKSATSHMHRTRVNFWATTVCGSMFMRLKSTVF
jgi:RNA-binding protein YhbY